MLNHDIGFLKRLPKHKIAALEAHTHWLNIARPKQIFKEDTGTLLMTGRGWGKSRSLQEDLWFRAAWNDSTRWAVIAPKMSDLKHMYFDSEHGFCRLIPKECMAGGEISKACNRFTLEIRLSNGSVIRGFSSENPYQLRGLCFDGCIGEDIESWCSGAGNPENQQFAALELFTFMDDHLRLRGAAPMRVSAGRRCAITEYLRQRSDYEMITGTSHENADNLTPAFLCQIKQHSLERPAI